MPKQARSPRFRAVFEAPAWPGEYRSQLDWKTEIAAGYYAASVLAMPDAWITETPSEHPVFLDHLARLPSKQGEKVRVRIERQLPS